VPNKNVSLFSFPKSTLSSIVSRLDLIWGQPTVSWSGQFVGCLQTADPRFPTWSNLYIGPNY
jgi:hypothetical protein